MGVHVMGVSFGISLYSSVVIYMYFYHAYTNKHVLKQVSTSSTDQQQQKLDISNLNSIMRKSVFGVYGQGPVVGN